MAELKEIKSRYAGKCAQCGREIREGWTVMFDPETKEVFCMPCSRNKGEAGAGDTLCPACEQSISDDAQYCPNCGAQIIRPPTTEEALAQVLAECRLIVELCGLLNDKIEAHTKDTFGKYESIHSALAKMAKPAKN